ncbi:hypothetical protein GF337_19345 [candidate division KSB1 bacterium]|nr:hypothetical protein [candidate division KSB1 bacterium]
MKPHLLIPILIIIITSMGYSMTDEITDILPEENIIQGWEIYGSDKVYGPDNLYEYINGGAELFLSYGFRQMVTRIYTAPDQPEIILDVFDMGKSKNAYGVFSYSRESEDSTFGQGSQYSPGLLIFWKDRYYVSILFTPETPAAKKTAFSIARHIESAIPEEGQLPEIISLLPQENLRQETIRYFHHHIWLNSYQFISNENILLIDENTEASLAKYDENGHRLVLLLIEYSDADLAATARNNFVEKYSSKPLTASIFKEEDQWSGYRQIKNYFAVIFNAAEKESTESYFNKIQTNIEKFQNN